MAAKRKSAKKPASKADAKRAPANKVAPKKPSARVAADGPSLFRVNVEVGNLDEAERFYGELLGQKGRRQRGARVYFDAGPVTLRIVDVASMGMACRIRPRRRSISSCAISRYGRGASARSTPRTGGSTRSASSRKERRIQVDYAGCSSAPTRRRTAAMSRIGRISTQPVSVHGNSLAMRTASSRLGASMRL